MCVVLIFLYRECKCIQGESGVCIYICVTCVCVCVCMCVCEDGGRGGEERETNTQIVYKKFQVLPFALSCLALNLLYICHFKNLKKQNGKAVVWKAARTKGKAEKVESFCLPFLFTDVRTSKTTYFPIFQHEVARREERTALLCFSSTAIPHSVSGNQRPTTNECLGTATVPSRKNKNKNKNLQHFESKCETFLDGAHPARPTFVQVNNVPSFHTC